MQNERVDVESYSSTTFPLNQEKDNVFFQILESLEDYAVITTDIHGIVTSWNSGAQKILGYAHEEIMGKNLDILFTPEDRKNGMPTKERKSALENGSAIDERWHLKKGGFQFFCSGKLFILKNEQGDTIGYTKIMRDITSRKIEMDIKKKQQLDLENLAETIPQLVWITGPDGYHEFYNKRWYEYTDTDELEAAGEGWSKLLHHDDYERAWDTWRHSLETGEPYEIEYRFRNGKTGEYRWFLGRALPVKDENGNITKWFGTCTDIDEQKRAIENQTFLAEASKILSSSLDYEETLQKVTTLVVPHIADWCAVDLLKGKQLEWVSIAHKDSSKIKYARELREKFPTDMNAKTGLAKVIKTGQAEFYPFLTEEVIEKSIPDPEELRLIKRIGFTSIMIVPLLINNKAIGAITFVSAESKKQYTSADLQMAQELAGRASLAIQNSQLFREVQKRDEQFNALYNSNIIGVLYCNLEGQIFDANDALLSLLGYTRKDLEKGKVRWDKATPMEFKAADEKALAELFETGVASPWEKEYIRKDGSQIPVIVGAALLNKETTETIAFVLDITERKKLEQRKDEFIGIASHELKTPLTSIKGYTQILERIIQQMGDDRLKTYLKKTNTYIDRLNSLIADLLDVSKIQAGKLQIDYNEFDFDELVKDGVESVQHTDSRHTIIIKNKINQKVYGDRHRLEQVFTNLLSNAIKYSPKSDKVVIEVTKNSKEIQVSIQDFGIGIPRSKQTKIFDRFYRVEESSKKFSGLGIGLYISSEIIHRHKGKIWVESDVGQGATFFFTLPLRKKKII